MEWKEREDGPMSLLGWERKNDKMTERWVKPVTEILEFELN